MVLDDISQFERYVQLNPLFQKVADFLANNDLSTLEKGKHEIDGEDLFVNIVDAKPKTREEARLETHIKMIDIQIPVSAPEEHGWTPLAALSSAEYDEANDIRFHEGLAQDYFTLRPGQFVIYFPADGHAPAITPNTIRKAIFKVKA